MSEFPQLALKEKIAIDKRDAVIIVVDMQNDFVHPDGKLFVPDARKTIPSIRKLIEKARENKIPIIYTQDWHGKKDPEFEIWGEHAVMDTWGAEIIEELAPKEDDILIKKLRYDPFYGTPLDHILRTMLKRNTLIIVGTVANICVLHTVASAALRWYDTIVPLDGISALNQYDFNLALRQMDFLYKTCLVRSVDGIEFK